MIKILLPCIKTIKTEYLVAIKHLVRARVEPLLSSIQHLDGGNIDTTMGNFERYKHLTRKIVNNYVIEKKLDDSLFNLREYKNTVEDFITKKSKSPDYAGINFLGIKMFLESLIDPNNNRLDFLLSCEATRLKYYNELLINKYKISGDDNAFILKKAFSYEDYGEISSEIKNYFRSRNLVKVCPYCNIIEVEYRATLTGRTATSHELDHFFNKAKHPLLSYSLFNLVPSDNTCNSTNKGQVEFNDEDYLNPYIEGFGKNMCFKPIFIGKKAIGIDIEVHAKKIEKIYRQMVGINGNIDEAIGSGGNINIFTLKTKYKDRTEEAEYIINTIYNRDKGYRSIEKIINQMLKSDINEIYKNWYRQNIRTFFDENKFHEKPYSKFNRDIHDYYYKDNHKQRNSYIKALIKSS